VSHTPGPWHVRQGSDCLHVVSDDTTMHTGCISFAGNGHANARLIAAAPEMLAALKLIESVYRQNAVADVSEPSSVLDAVQAAIAKADGRS
jgi:hypothetical protein